MNRNARHLLGMFLMTASLLSNMALAQADGAPSGGAGEEQQAASATAFVLPDGEARWMQYRQANGDRHIERMEFRMAPTAENWGRHAPRGTVSLHRDVAGQPDGEPFAQASFLYQQGLFLGESAISVDVRFLVFEGERIHLRIWHGSGIDLLVQPHVDMTGSGSATTERQALTLTPASGTVSADPVGLNRNAEGLARVEEVGEGAGPLQGAQAPSLSAMDGQAPTLGNQEFGVQVQSVDPYSYLSWWFALGANTADATEILPGRHLYLDSESVSAFYHQGINPLVEVNLGQQSYQLMRFPIPNDPALAGQQFALQVMVISPIDTVDPIGTTNALLITMGR